MRSALELRAPYLDQAVMEFAASLPVAERVRGVTTKVFLKRFALRYLPSRIVSGRKRGLSVPLARWLRGPLHGWAMGRLGDSRLRMAGVDPDAAVRLLEAHRSRQGDHARALWTLIVLAEWLEWAPCPRGSSAKVG
jgi:asparagine synthase (glutamine-hydrolysing)